MNTALLLLLGHNYIFPEDSFLNIRSALLPVGAAYYTAKGFSYCFDVYTGRCKAEKNIFCLMTYMVSFHSFMGGPVNRYGDTEPGIRKRTVTGQLLSDGLTRFIIGLGKSVILAQAFARIRIAGLDHADTTLAGSWVGMTAFLAECWFSFTGICDMAKGLGLMNGFEYEDNYRQISTGELITGFFKSANTTLIRLFTDVLRSVAGSSKAMGCAALFAGCVLIALWYHVGAMFLIVGVAAGAVMVIERLFLAKAFEKLPAAVKAVYVLPVSLLILGGLYFTDFSEYTAWLGSLFGSGNSYILTKALRSALLGNLWLIVIAFVSVCEPCKKLVLKGVAQLEKDPEAGLAIVRVGKTLLTAAILLICVITLAAEAV